MRIRKRFLSLYGAVTAPPLSDLLAGDHHQIGVQPCTLVSSGDCSHTNNTTKIFKELDIEIKKEIIKSDFRKESMLCAEENNHDLVMKGWFKGENLVPTKKKRGSYGKRLNNNNNNDDDDDDDDNIIEKTMKVKKKMNKKDKRRDGLIMEGSRCSRVNGRGWRCSQQTIAGYSLCEHHLGKGRVRNMAGFRAKTSAQKDKKHESPSMVEDEDDDDVDEDEEEEEFKDLDVESTSSMEGTKVFGKKMKIGVVKARSLSSLLSQISS